MTELEADFYYLAFSPFLRFGYVCSDTLALLSAGSRDISRDLLERQMRGKWRS